MKVLVSGSHGLIGSAICSRLEQEGHEIVPLVRGAQSDPPGPRVGWEPEQRRLDNGALAQHAPYDAVIHLAGPGIGDRRWTPDRRRRLREDRVEGTRLLADALSRLDPPPAVLISASAVGFYGDRGEEVLDEDGGAGRGFLAQLCHDWEAATLPARTAGIRVTALRSGVVLASHGGALARQLPIFKLGLGGRLGTGRQWLSWIALDDEVGVILRALDDESLGGPLNATAPSPIRNADFTAALGRALDRPVPFPVPRAALAAAFGSGMADEMVLASQRVLPARLTGSGHRFAYPEIDDALAFALGHL